MRDAHEMWMMLLITVVTNITMFPAVWCLHKSGRVFDTCFGLLTAITSCLYHICDSIDSPLWLDEGQWHRLDNIATITSIVCWIIYLMDIQQRVVEEYTQYVLFIFVLICQQKNPWDPANSFAPILGSLLILMFRYMLFHPIPSYHKRELGMGFLFLFCGVCFYIRGLDDENDPYRFFHGCWHGLSGIAAYYNIGDLNTRAIQIFIMSAWSDRFYALDLRAARNIYRSTGSTYQMRLLWETISYTGDGLLWILIVLPVLFVFWMLGFLERMNQNTKSFIREFYICILVDLMVIFILKISIKRQRPPHHKTDARFVGPDQHSFPSGHATRALCITRFIFDYSSRSPEHLKSILYVEASWICIFTIFWATIICYSRVALGRHYPSDVVVGAFVGLLLEYPIASYTMNHFSAD